MDPARPLVTGSVRLSSGDAAAVHVLHTNAGHYGEAGRAGHVDFCINGGKIQPFCENSGSKLDVVVHLYVSRIHCWLNYLKFLLDHPVFLLKFICSRYAVM